MSTSEGERWSIGEVARRSGIAASTLRYYESIGLLAPAERAGGSMTRTSFPRSG